MRMKEETQPFQVRFPKDLLSKLALLAKARDLTVAQLLRRLAADYVRKTTDVVLATSTEEPDTFEDLLKKAAALAPRERS